MPTVIDAAKEAEEKLLEAVKAECRKLLETMRLAQPAEAERMRTRLEEVIKRCPKLPPDFNRKILADARALECTSNTRAADVALHAAMRKAKEDDAVERNRLVGQARGYANKAISLGADPAFRATVNRKIEIIMMTGNVEQKGPTLAKPLDATPRPSSAKG
jgi:acetylornithine/succinyldiaminopimelate/putrescine aminotransferase